MNLKLNLLCPYQFILFGVHLDQLLDETFKFLIALEHQLQFALVDEVLVILDIYAELVGLDKRLGVLLQYQNQYLSLVQVLLLHGVLLFQEAELFFVIRLSLDRWGHHLPRII